MKKYIKIIAASACLFLNSTALSAEAESHLDPFPLPADEQVLESGRDFYVIGRIDREGMSPEDLPVNIRVDVAETGLVGRKIIPVRTVS